MSLAPDMATLDPQGICRCCLSDRRETLRSIFDSSIRDMYVACTSLQITPNDGLPGSICGMCIFKCISWSSFKQLCERSEMMLKIQFNIQPLTSVPITIHDDEQTQSAFKEECMLEIVPAEPTDIIVSLVDTIPSSDFNESVNDRSILTITESNEGQIHVEESSNDSIETFNEHKDEYVQKQDYNRQDALQIDENEEEDLITIVNDMDYMDELSDAEEETEESKITSTRVSMRKISKQRLAKKNPKQCLPCDKCDLTFQLPERLEAHSRIHLGLKPEVCTVCNKGFDNQRALYRHRLKHSDDKVFPCPKCGKTYKYQTSLTLHLKIHANGKCFVCDHCGKSFDRVHGLQSHMLSHSTDTPFECDQCEKRFKNEVMLRNHKLRHEGVKKFACDTCGKSFATTAELRTHSRMHTGQKPFQCSDCDKAFKTKSHLTVHFRTHTGDRPYSCDMCDQKFAHLKVLKHHRMVHTGERPHICSICERPFRQRSTLKVHMRTHRARHELDSSADEATSKDN